MVELIIAALVLASLSRKPLVRAGGRRAGIPDAICHAVVFDPHAGLGYAAGRAHYGFPYLSGAGRLVLKPLMLAGAVMIWRTPPVRYFTATVATLLPSHAAIRPDGACASVPMFDE